MAVYNGDAGDNVYYGTNLADIINGHGGNDRLSGQGGNDTIDGGEGADRMFGGLGNDIYFVDNRDDFVWENIGAGNADHVYASTGYRLRQSLEQLTLTGAAAINGTGNDGDNILTGNDAANMLKGEHGNDRLFGLGGNDILNGGSGVDEMHGGKGDDLYVVDNADDLALEEPGGGIDTVHSSDSFRLGANVENLTLTGILAINAIGNEMANIIRGNGKASIIDGGQGADQMIGGHGDDTYIVDSAGDSITELNQQGNDTVRSSVSFSIAGQFIENLVLTGTAATDGTGNNLDNSIIGNDAANTLDGGLGGDRLTGGRGDDTYIIDNIRDLAVETRNQGTDTVRTSVDYSLSGQFIENLTLVGNQAIRGTGNSLDNIITGNARANTIDGGLGHDTLFGGLGDDTFLYGVAPSSWSSDSIVDFNVADDRFALDMDVFGAFTTIGQLAAAAFKNLAFGDVANTDRIIFDQANGDVWYDRDGSGHGNDAILLAHLDNDAILTHRDFFIV